MKLTYKFKLAGSQPSLDSLCRVSNDLYNQANYHIKKELDKSGKWLRYNELDKLMKVTPNLQGTVNYCLLKAQTSQQLLQLLDKNWTSYFRSVKDFKANPKKYRGLPRPPRFRNPGDRNLLIFTNQNSVIRDEQIILEKGLSVPIPTGSGKNFTDFQQIRILPRSNGYEIEIVYNQEAVNLELDQENYLSADLGVGNFATCISKDKTFILSGKHLKSENHYYNKKRAKIQSHKDKKGGKQCKRKLRQLSSHRSNYMNDQLHKMSRLIVNYCIAKNIGTVVIGRNKCWKDSTTMGTVSNQNFVSIPHALFIKFLKYKCGMVGIIFICKNESYTSKCDGLALEPVQKHKKYLGRRKHRGIFQSSVGKLINADVNGALNTLRKVIGDGLFILGLIDSAVLFNPMKIRFTDIVSGQTLLNLLEESVKSF